jgi:hypothetical protein
MSALTTEHFTLQAARGSTVSESAARASLYVSVLSSALIALRFLGQRSTSGLPFRAFVLVALPTVYGLGVFSLARLVQGSLEDLFYGRAISRVRAVYEEIAGEKRSAFVPEIGESVEDMLANMALARPSRWQLFFTTATMVAFVNSVLLDAVTAVGVGSVGSAPVAAWVSSGVAVATLSLWAHLTVQRRMHVRARPQVPEHSDRP